MSEYGVRIKNYQAASIYGYNIGIRNRMHETDAMLVNSLFLDFLMENGLETWKGESTRDVICLEFGYGSPSYQDEVKKHRKKIKELESDAKMDENLKAQKIEYQKQLIEQADENEMNFKEISKNDLRTLYYVNGVDVQYPKYNKKGEIVSTDTIHYRMLYRTPGKAKKGTCMFIREELYGAAHNFLYMGIELPEKNSPIVEIGAYASLITSSIVGKIKIDPSEILIVKDFDSFVTTDVVEVYTDEKRECHARKIENYESVSTAFDGQALIDLSIFPPWADGYVLLRHHMTKCAAFATDIQQFMKDKFGAEYDTATVKDMWGNDVPVKNIKLITTDNAIKWLKFSVTFDYWSHWVRQNGCMFGVVKTAHESKLGDVQRMSYQMVNSLDINTMESVTQKSVDYINALKSDDNVFIDYLRHNADFANDYDVLVALCEHNNDFVKSTYFRERKSAIIESYVLNFKSGRCVQNADNLTIVGSPYAMLLHSIGENPMDDPTFKKEEGCIQCWVERFDDGEYLAEFRNPFNSRNNLGYLHNVHHEFFDKYFKLGKLCIAVNMIETDFQNRNNGSDQDSDSIYTTNHPDIVSHAKYCYENYPTIVNKIKPEKNIYDYSLENYAKIDNALTAAQLAIGQSSNLAQLALSYTYNFEKGSEEYEKYYDYVCILSVLAQVAIDNAKRRFEVDLEKEIPRIAEDMGVDLVGLPQFWQITKKDKRKFTSDEARNAARKKNKEKIVAKLNKDLICPMNYLFNIKFENHRNVNKAIPMKEFFVNHPIENDRRNSKKVEELIEAFALDLYEYNLKGENWDYSEDRFLLRDDFENLITEIRKLNISRNYAGMMSWLINRAFMITSQTRGNMDSTLSKNRSILIKVLYSVNKNTFLSCFKENA